MAEISTYTDVVKQNNRVKVGDFSAKINTRSAFCLPDDCIVFQAEITAIKENFLVLARSPLTIRNIFIYTDSQGALRYLNFQRVTPKVVKECLDFLVYLATYFVINL